MKYTLLFLLLLLGRLHLEQSPRPAHTAGPLPHRPSLAALAPFQAALLPPHAR
ncbi:hypothetical protein MUN81_15780 [Hymenobacter sp. 5317J-9]|uniref:hypothetical protein n=1 Tax=Hymenobacter sp. 5317J-9 TaxID=2932250 RepID=UPI001FD63DF8|nr:hypothetical protein [Hymenobacter sp. 5317J-9]UOQ96695.1 hypothetical protein MUN81_15780 [Hymenobacter sp. 5317J-9]